MAYRNTPSRKEAEPKVIAVSATRTVVDPALLWAMGIASLAYAWLALLS